MSRGYAAGSAKAIHKETGSPLDATVYVGKERPGMHPVIAEPAHEGAFSLHSATMRPDPKGEGRFRLYYYHWNVT